MIPTVDEVNHEINKTELAVAAFSELFENGGLSSLDFGDAVSLIDDASQSPQVAANAFGLAPTEGDTPEALRSRLMDVYTQQYIQGTVQRIQTEAEERAHREADDHRNTMIQVLGLTPDEVARYDFDAEHGDTSLWDAALEHYIFG